MRGKILRASVLLVLAIALSQLALADTYVINFFEQAPGTAHYGVLPTSGSFDYDPVNGFSNFIVVWSGFAYDLTSSANSPSILAPSGCAGEAATPQYGFALMSGALSSCPNQFTLPGFPLGGSWEGNAYYTPEFDFSIFAGTGADEIFADQAHNNYTDFSFPRGWWTITDTSNPNGNGAVPEPGSLVLLGTGLGGVARVVRRRTAARPLGDER